MLQPHLYEPERLFQFQQRKLQNHPQFYLRRSLIVEQKLFIQQLLYMVQGLETQLFVKIYEEQEFDEEFEQCQRVFNFSLRGDCKTSFTHLTAETVQKCSQLPIKIANFAQYLTSKSKIIYQKTFDPFTKSLTQGILKYCTQLTSQFTLILSQLQKELGCLSRSQNSEVSEGFKGLNTHISLLKINHLFEQKIVFISELVGIISKILPYALSPDPVDCYRTIQIILNQFYRLVDLIHFSQNDKKQTILIFQNCLAIYIELIQNWIEMNPYKLELKKQLPFFIKISQINFSLSRSVENVKIFRSLRNSSLTQLESKQQAYNNQEFVELFFKLDNLLVQQYIPQMFKKQGLCILELGKIIQFIYLYFSIQEKQLLYTYIDAKKQFASLFQLLETTSFPIDSLKARSHQRSFLKNETLMASSLIKKISISQKLASKIRKPYRCLKTQEENPYQVYSNTKGSFIEFETTIQDLKNKFESNKRFIDGKTKEIKVQQMPLLQKNLCNLGKSLGNESFSIRFERILSEIIERLYVKILYFFQQQGPIEFLRHSSSLVYNRLNMISNHKRIIQSISLTLKGIKSFMLYEQGDFFVEFFFMVNTLFDNSYTKISRNLITSCIEEAIKSSSAKDLPEQINQKISFFFLKKTKDPLIKQLKVWSVFSILFKPQFPANCIFNKQIMHSFGEIFNFVFNIKHCEHSLKMIWGDFKQNAKIQTQYSLFQTKKHPFEAKILAVRNNIHHFINAMFGFVMIMIQNRWLSYIQQINLSFLGQKFNSKVINSNQNKGIHNPISLIRLTHQLLRNLKLQTTQNLTLANTLILISELLERFKKLLKMQPDSKQWSDATFNNQINYIRQKFMGIMQMVKQVERFSEVISYNDEI